MWSRVPTGGAAVIAASGLLSLSSYPPPLSSVAVGVGSTPRGVSRKVAGDQFRETAHHHVTGRGIGFEDLQHFLSIHPEHARAFPARRARDAARLLLDERVPAEELASSEPETGRAHVFAAADEELDAPGFEDEEILGRFAHVVDRAVLGELLAFREAFERRERLGAEAGKERRRL